MEGTPWTRADRDNAAMSVFRITPAILLAALAPPACGQGGSDDSQASARTGHRAPSTGSPVTSSVCCTAGAQGPRSLCKAGLLC